MTRLRWLGLSLLFTAALGRADGVSDERAAELQNLLIQDCGSCHGLQMKGGLGPALLPENLDGKSAELVSAVILYGRPGTAMPPWSALLSAQEVDWMVQRLLQSEAR